MPTANINGNLLVKTAAQWAVDATVYSSKKILITSDAFYTGTDQHKFKLGDGAQTWSNLDYFDPYTYALAQAAAAQAAAQAYADGLVVGLWDDRGNYDPTATSDYPVTGGSGPAGAILKGDIWTVSVAGTISGNVVGIGDTVRALVDAPGLADGNWAIGENNIGYVPESQANKDTDGTLAANSDVKYASQKATKTYADGKVADAITDGVTTIAPSQNAVFDALALKANLTDIWTTVVLPADVTNDNAIALTMQDITGLEFSVVAGTYAFRAMILYTAAATTTGSKWGVNGSVAADNIAYRTTASVTGSTVQSLNSSGYDAGGASVGSAATTGNIATIEGLIVVSGAGIITMRFASEVAGSAIVAKQGSVMQYKKVV